jgi:hypothetical protein
MIHLVAHPHFKNGEHLGAYLTLEAMGSECACSDPHEGSHSSKDEKDAFHSDFILVFVCNMVRHGSLLTILYM